MSYPTDFDSFSNRDLIGQPDSTDAPFELYFPTFKIMGLSTLVGKKVQIPKGTVINSTHPSYPPEGRPAGRTLTVTVRSATKGYYAPEVGRSASGNLRYYPAEVTWVGTGGYWMDAPLRDCILAPEVEL